MSSRSHSATLQASLLAASLAFAAPALAADVTVTLPAGDGFVVKDNTGAIERLRVDEATGNISRNGALFVHTTSLSGNSTFVGRNAGANVGSFTGRNTGFGWGVLQNSDSTFSNSAFGYRAMFSNRVWNLCPHPA